VKNLQYLTFHPTPLTLVASTLAIVLLLWLSWRAIRSQGGRWSAVGMEVFRILLVLAAIALLNQPEWVENYRPEAKPTVAVLLDHSYSMRTPDVASLHRSSAEEETSAVMTQSTRRQAIDPLLALGQSEALNTSFRIITLPFGKEEPSGQSDLQSPLEAALRDYPELHAVVLASDGDWNSGGSPAIAAAQYRLKEIPIFSVPVGSPSQLPDLEILAFDVPSFGIVNKTVTIPVTIESSLPRAATLELRIENSAGTQETQEVVIQPMGRTLTTVRWKPTQVGDFTLIAILPTHPEEFLSENNRRSATIAIREERLKVLLIESLPRWEYRYLRNALLRDAGVEVSCLLFHPGLSKVGGGGRDYLPEFPATFEELSRYDVVFVGDVGLEKGQLSREDCRQLKGLVQRQASGLVFMPGWQGRQQSLLDTELAELMPVVFDSEQPEGWGTRTPAHFELTEVGRRSLLTRLADSVDDNLKVWENLPGFQWYAPVLRAKAGTEILAVHPEASSPYGRLPLLVTQAFGVGKVLFMGTDGAWRWRKGVEDLYHYRFWGQVVRWMAYQRNMATGESMRLYYSPEQPDVGQTIFLNANVMEANGEPMNDGEVTARIISPSGLSQTVTFKPQGDEWGAFSSRFIAQEAGLHELSLRSSHHRTEVKTSLLVQGQMAERLGKAARPEVMVELASLTQGRVLQVADVESTLRELDTIKPRMIKNRRWPLWSQAWVAVTLIGLMAAFWMTRKVLGQM
jgi:hypothetical protein